MKDPTQKNIRKEKQPEEKEKKVNEKDQTNKEIVKAITGDRL
jgi:hypothetical protein